MTIGNASPSLAPDSKESELRTRSGIKVFASLPETIDEATTGSVGVIMAPNKHAEQQIARKNKVKN